MRDHRILTVDDFEDFRRFVCSVLQQRAEFQVTEASNGREAIQKAEELQPDLILLDIGLPDLNGLEVAKRVRELVRATKILFLSQESSPDVVREALNLGTGYVHKQRSQIDLLPAIDAVLGGQQFVSSTLEFGAERVPSQIAQLEKEFSIRNSKPLPAASTDAFATGGFPLRSVHHQGHVVQFYTEDAHLMESLCALFSDGLSKGGSVVAVMTKSHRSGVEKRLIAEGIEMSEATKNGRLTMLDADQALSDFMEANGPNRERFLSKFGAAIRRAEAAALVKNRRVVAFGEMVAVLWAQKKYDAAIRLEELWNELVLAHPFYLCCAYPASEFHGSLKAEPYAQICARHTEVVAAF